VLVFREFNRIICRFPAFVKSEIDRSVFGASIFSLRWEKENDYYSNYSIAALGLTGVISIAAVVLTTKELAGVSS